MSSIGILKLENVLMSAAVNVEKEFMTSSGSFPCCFPHRVSTWLATLPALAVIASPPDVAVFPSPKRAWAAGCTLERGPRDPAAISGPRHDDIVLFDRFVSAVDRRRSRPSGQGSERSCQAARPIRVSLSNR